MVYIITGVSGVGKTTIGLIMAKELNLPFYDADDFHPSSNTHKMKNGIPLNDEDRQPWLAILADRIKVWNKEGGAVLACSALKEKYRQTLQVIDQSEIRFIFLHADASLIFERLQKRKGHYMDSGLLDSQFEALEQPNYGIHVQVNKSPDLVLKEIIDQIT